MVWIKQDIQKDLVHVVFRLLFITGIEYTLGRVPIGSTDFSTRTYSYDDIPEDLNLHWFSLSREDKMYKVSAFVCLVSILVNLISYHGSSLLWLWLWHIRRLPLFASVLWCTNLSQRIDSSIVKKRWPVYNWTKFDVHQLCLSSAKSTFSHGTFLLKPNCSPH